MNSNPTFRWGSLDHESIEKELERLKVKIEKEIKNAGRLAPIPDHPGPGSFMPERQARSFEILQQENADDWVSRAYKVYCDGWAAKGGEKTQDFVLAVWCNALYYFASSDVLNLLRLAFGIDERATKLLAREYRGLPQAVEAARRATAVNRIRENVLKLWSEEKIPSESTALKALIARSNCPNTDLLKVDDLKPIPAPVTTLYDRTKENNLKASWTQDPEDQSVRQRLRKELTDQKRLAKELATLQGPQLAITVFGRTDLEIAAEIDLLEIGLRDPSEEERANAPIIEPDPTFVAPPVFSHSESYESITFDGESYTLQKRQADVIRLLHDSLKRGHPEVPTTKLLNLPGCGDVATVRDIFKSRLQLWGKLIVNCEDTGKGRGFYRLHPSIKG